MDDAISRQALCEYALNQKDKSVTPNDIMRFPSAQSETNCLEFPNGSDTISRQAAIKTAHLPTIEDAGCEVIRLDDILILPSAEPEIIRCRDCKHWEREKLGDNELRHGTCYSPELFNCINGNTYNVDDFQTNENFYCGFADRGQRDEILYRI